VAGSRDALLYLLSGLAQRASPVLALPVLSRIVSPESLGEIAAALAVANVLTIIMGLGLNSAILRLYFDDDARSPKKAWAALTRIQLGGATLIATTAVVAGPVWSELVFEELRWGQSLIAAVLLAFAMSRLSTILAVVRSSGHVEQYLALTLASGPLGVFLGLLAATSWNAGGYIGGLLAGYVVAVVAGEIIHYAPAAWRWRELQHGMYYSIILLAHMVAGWVFTMSDRVLLERFLPLEAVGEYFVAYAIATGTYLAFDSIQAVWVTNFYASTSEEKARFVRGAPASLTLIGGLVAITVASMAPHVLHVFMPSYDFWVVVAVTFITVGIVSRPMYLVCFTALSDQKTPRPLALSSALAAAISVTLNIILIPKVGIAGAGITYSVVSVAQAAIVITATRRTWLMPKLGRVAAIWSSLTAITLATLLMPLSGAGIIARSGLGLGCLALAILTSRRFIERARRVPGSH
jgi:O-antigen/teichoic acid export membrane protein